MDLIRFTNQDLPNVHIEVEKGKVYLRVSINIPSDLKRFLGNVNVFKSKKLYVYSIRQRIDLSIDGTVYPTYRVLMDRARVNVRSAKIRKLESEISGIIRK